MNNCNIFSFGILLGWKMFDKDDEDDNKYENRWGYELI